MSGLTTVRQTLAENKRLVFTPLGLICDPHANIPYEEWFEAGIALKQAQSTVDTVFALCWGDWINEGQRRYGEKYAQALEMIGRDYQTLSNWAWVARKTPPELRGLSNVTFTHYLLSLREPDTYTRWIKLIRVSIRPKEWSTRKFQEILPPSQTELPDPPPSTTADKTFETLVENQRLKDEVLRQRAELEQYAGIAQETSDALKEVADELPPEQAKRVQLVIESLKPFMADQEVVTLINEVIDSWEAGNIAKVGEYLDELAKKRRELSWRQDNSILVRSGNKEMRILH